MPGVPCKKPGLLGGRTGRSTGNVGFNQVGGLFGYGPPGGPGGPGGAGYPPPPPPGPGRGLVGPTIVGGDSPGYIIIVGTPAGDGPEPVHVHKTRLPINVDFGLGIHAILVFIQKKSGS